MITNEINFYKDLVKDSHELVDEWNHSEYKIQKCKIELSRNLIVIRQIMINIENIVIGVEKAPFSIQNTLFSILFSL